MKNTLLLAAVAALVPACDKADRAGEPAAYLDTASDGKAIRSANERWLQVIAAKNKAAIAQFYAEDAALMPQGEPAVRGRRRSVSGGAG